MAAAGPGDEAGALAEPEPEEEEDDEDEDDEDEDDEPEDEPADRFAPLEPWVVAAAVA